MKLLMTMLLFFTCLSPGVSHAWGEPDPITLAIPHFEQETSYWCWAALVQQTIAWRNFGRPDQCQIVGMANAAKEIQPFDCCTHKTDPGCNRPGNLPEIKAIIAAYGGRAESVSPPNSPEEVYNYLMNQKALICGIKYDANNNHIYLVKGIYWTNGEAILVINDPATSAHRELPFKEARPTWMETLAVE